MSTKKPCINYPACTYTGKEQSPLRFGLSAEGYAVNSVLEGHDKHLWVVEIKNNKKVWVRKEETFKITPEDPVILNTTQTTDTQTAQHTHNITNVPNMPVPSILNTQTPQSLHTEKKTTDYNLYLSYRLKQLKEQSNETDNKKNFNQVIQEWKVIKNKPEELQKILGEAKKQLANAPPVVKKTTNSKKPSASKVSAVIVQPAVLADQDIPAPSAIPAQPAEPAQPDTPNEQTVQDTEKNAKPKKRTNKK